MKGYLSAVILGFYKNRHMNGYAFILPVVSGLVLLLAFPPFEMGFLAWLALLPLLWFCLRATPRTALAGGFLFGLVLHTYLNIYLAGVLFEHLSTLMAFFTLTLLIILTAFFYAGFAGLISLLKNRVGSAALTAAIPSMWVLMEYARSLGFAGYTVGYLGYTQWSYRPLLNLAAVYGYWGLPFFMIALQSILLLAGTRSLKGKKLILTASILIILFMCGLAIPELGSPVKTDQEHLVALIQANSAPEEILSQEGKKTILERHLAMTRQAVTEKANVGLVVWPETVVDLFKNGRLQHKPEMVELARELNISILYGARVRTGGKLYNSIVLLSPDDEDFQVYHKQRLVPGVEYFPFDEQLNSILNTKFQVGGYQQGDSITLFNYKGITLAGVVCFESYFGDYTRLFARNGGRHMFILTNDVWFDDTIGLEQHVQAAAIRAAEMGIGVTQVANSGITASYDYRGRELFRSGKSERKIFFLPLNFTSKPTVYRYCGDLLPAACLLLLICLFQTWVIYWYRKKKRVRTL
jgi:apolipoprotein N-acyltransferase